MCSSHSDTAGDGDEDISRRRVLRGMGVAGASVGLAGSRLGRLGDDGNTAATLTTALPDGVRPVPVRGGCTAAVGDAACTDGTVGLYDNGGKVGFGQHTYQLTLNGVPLSVFSGPLDFQQFMVAGGANLKRIPQPPPSAGPDWGPYELFMPAGSINLGVDEDLAAPVRLVPPECEIPPSCRARWCDAVEQTVDGLQEQRRTLEQELIRRDAKLAGRSFSVTVPSKAQEMSARLRLRAKVNTAIETEVTLLRGAVNAARPIPDLPEECGDCPTCVRMPRAHRVRSWELRITEQSSAQWSIDETDNWASHELRTRTILEPPGVAGAAHVAGGGGGPLGGIIGPILRLLDGIGSVLDGLFGGGGQPARKSWMGKPVEAAGWMTHGYVADTENGTVGLVNSAEGTVTDPEKLSQFGDITMFFEDDQYELSTPTAPLTGRSMTFGLPENTNSPFEQDVGWGDAITRRAASDGVGGATQSDGEDSPARFPLSAASECGSGLSHRVEVDLDGEGLIQQRSGMLPPEQSPQGTASIEWELVPQEIDDGEVERIDCL